MSRHYREVRALQRNSSTQVAFLAAVIAGVVLTGPNLARAEALADDPITAREWNSAAIAGKAKRLPTTLRVRPNDIVVNVPTWNVYLRLALLGNQDPYKRGYLNTYLRCWSDRGWKVAAEGSDGLLGFYDPLVPAWIHARVATCNNAAKAARGELSPTTIVALGTILHETLHRQGIKREDHAACLAVVGVWQSVNRTSGKVRALLAWETLMGWYRRNLEGEYRRGLDGCEDRARFAWNDTRVWR